MRDLATQESEPATTAPPRQAVAHGVAVHGAAQMGNRAFARALQRVSRPAQVRDAADDAARADELAKMTIDDMADTLLDPGLAEITASAGLRAAVDALPMPAKPIVSAGLRAATGPWDEQFYYSLGLLEPGTRELIWNALKVRHPQVATSTARSAAMNAALSGFVRANAVPEALKMLNGYGMPDLLDLLLYADAAGFLVKLKVGLTADAPGIDAQRLEAAMLVVRVRPALTRLLAFGIPLDKRGQAELVKTLDERKAQDERAATDLRASNPAAAEKGERGALSLGTARADLETLFFLLEAKTVGVGDIAAMNAFVSASGIEGFRNALGVPEAFTQGQFVLSAAASGKLWEIIEAQRAAIGATDPAEVAALTAATDGLNGAFGGIYVGAASASYGRVAVSAQACLKAFQSVAGAHGVRLTPGFLDVFKKVVGAPKDGQAFSKAMQSEWQPLWNEWLRTKTMPDMTREANVYRFTWLRMADQWACQPMTMKMAELYDVKTAGTANARLDPNDPEAAKKRQAAALPLTTLYAGTKKTVGPGGHVTDERVTYRKDLGTVIERVRTALDAGWFVHVRVLSGVAMDYTSSRAAGEHSLLIVGHRGNAFFCSDADPGGEGSAMLQVGSTTLFYDAGGNTFATAAEQAMTVDESGMQRTNWHHRYQAWTIQTK